MQVFWKFPTFQIISTPKKHPRFSGFLPLSKTKEKKTQRERQSNSQQRMRAPSEGNPTVRSVRLVVSRNIFQSESKSLFQHWLCVTYLRPESGIFTATLPVHWHDSDVRNRIMVKPWTRRESTRAHQVLGLPCTFKSNHHITLYFKKFIPGIRKSHSFVVKLAKIFGERGSPPSWAPPPQLGLWPVWTLWAHNGLPTAFSTFSREPLASL